MDNSNIPQKIIDLWQYLDNMKYHASSENLIEFYHFIGRIPEFLSFENMEPYIRTFVVKTKEQDDAFHQDFQYFVKNYKKITQSIEDKRKELEKKYEQIERNLKKREEKICNKQKQLEQYTTNQKLKLNKIRETHLKDYEKMEKALKKMTSQLQKMSQGLQNNEKELIKKILNKDSLYTLNEIQEIQELLPKLLKQSINSSNMMELMGLIKQLKTYFEKLEKDTKENVEKSEDQLLSELEQLEKQQKKEQEMFDHKLDNIKKELQNEANSILKQQSLQHREEFQSVGKSVKSNALAENKMLNKNFKQLTKEEKLKIEQYIYENLRVFRTRLTRKIKGRNKKELDMAETCKKACATNGIPLRLCYEKPMKQKTKLMLFLDVSGSCSNASELMLTFAYYLQEAFPAGCKCYAFTNKLYDISKLLDMPNGSSAVQEVLNAIPRSGAYSDYNKPLKDFYENHMQELTKDTICIFIGDARNNKNESGEEYLKAICRRSKKSWWMNTESIEKWNVNDSIIGIYQPYLNKLDEVLTPNGLLQFILN